MNKEEKLLKLKLLNEQNYNDSLIECVNYLQQENKQLKERIDKVIDKLTLLVDIGFDYDGFNTIESLKGLIDELISYARDSRKILKGVNDD